MISFPCPTFVFSSPMSLKRLVFYMSNNVGSFKVQRRGNCARVILRTWLYIHVYIGFLVLFCFWFNLILLHQVTKVYKLFILLYINDEFSVCDVFFLQIRWIVFLSADMFDNVSCFKFWKCGNGAWVKSHIWLYIYAYI